MIKIEYPQFKARIRNEGNAEQIFDPFRRKWVALTAEEWVRQNFLQYLVHQLLFPASLIAIEKELLIGEMRKRFDIVVYNQNAIPAMVIECKEMNVSLTDKVLQQVLRYNTNMQARFLVITNGSYCAVYEKKGIGFEEIDIFPIWNKL